MTTNSFGFNFLLLLLRLGWVCLVVPTVFLYVYWFLTTYAITPPEIADNPDNTEHIFFSSVVGILFMLWFSKDVLWRRPDLSRNYRILTLVIVTAGGVYHIYFLWDHYTSFWQDGFYLLSVIPIFSTVGLFLNRIASWRK